MLPKHCTDTNMSRIASVSVPPIRTPAHIDILWIRTHHFERSTKKSSGQNHKHSFFEVHFVFKGFATYNIAGLDRCFGEGDAVLIPPELPHQQKSVSEDLVKVNFSFIAQNTAFDALLREKGYYFAIDKQMMEDFERIFAEVERRGAYYAYMIGNCIFSILCSILRSKGLSDGTEYAEKESVSCKLAMRYVQDNKNLFLNCSAVAAYCGCNEKYLSRCFKQEYGITLLEYIHSVKITEAKRLLVETDALLCEIAEMLGFSNEYYFNSFFKHRCGLTPGGFRARERQQAIPKC